MGRLFSQFVYMADDYVVDNYHFDGCPGKIQGCSLDQTYAMAFEGCRDLGVFSRVQDCFVGRVTAMAKRLMRGMHNDPDHFHPIRVAGYYLTMCHAREATYAEAERYVFAAHHVARPHGLLPFIPGFPGQTASCQEGIRRYVAGLDAELDNYMRARQDQHGGSGKVLNPLTGRLIQKDGKLARKLGIS